MFIPVEAIAELLEKYKYFLIFPIAVVEGPIITVISGFLAYIGVLNFYLAWILLTVADFIGDTLYFIIGRKLQTSPRIKKIASYLGYTEKSEIFLVEHFKRHTGKTLLISKIAHGIGGSIQVAAGLARVEFPVFFFYTFVGTIPKIFSLYLVGYYAGSSYIKVNGYLNLISVFTVGAIILFIIYVITGRIARNYLEHNSKKGE